MHQVQKKPKVDHKPDLNSMAKYFALPFCLFIIFGLIIYTVNLNNQLTESQKQQELYQNNIYRLGKNLYDKKHVYDIKFLIHEGNETYEFYGHKQILIANSKFFEILFTREPDLKEIEYHDVSRDEFTNVMDILYLGEFSGETNPSMPPIKNLPNILKYLDKFYVLSSKAPYLDKLYSKNPDFSDFHFISSHLYPTCRKFGLVMVQNEILKHIYSSWRKQSFFNATHVSQNPVLFYDYVKFLNC